MTVRKLIAASCLLCLVAAGSLLTEEPLGDFARRQREERSRLGLKPAKVYTNDNLPPRPPWESGTVSSMSSAPAAAPMLKPPAAAEAKEGPSALTPQQSKEEKPADKMKTKEFWQSRFKPLREQIARAKEEQDLVENELQLLQVQLARELNADAQNDLKQKIAAKTSEVEQKKAASEEAQKALSKLEDEFKDSGAPEDWSKTD